MNNSHFQSYKNQLTSTVQGLSNESLEAVKNAFLATYEKGGTIYFFGNGGSGATASHIAGDFLKGASYGLQKRFKTLCLNDNNASMMAISNDISYDDVFVEPLKNFLETHDLVIGISGSGNSTNVVKAMSYAKEKGAATIAFCGFKGGKIKDIADISLHAEVMDMEITEDVHMMAFHMVKQAIISELHGDLNASMGTQYDARVK